MKYSHVASFVLSAIPTAATPTSAAQPAPTIHSPSRAGATISNGTVVAISAQFEFPGLRSNLATAAAQAVVGIDAFNCTNSFLAGIQWTCTPEGDYKPSAFAQWADEAPQAMGVDVFPTDYLVVKVRSVSSRAGEATLINLTSGKNATIKFSDKPALCNANANWLVIDPAFNASSPSIYNTLGDFTAELFFGATYDVEEKNSTSSTYTSAGASVINMVRDVNGSQTTFANSYLFHYNSDSVATWYGSTNEQIISNA